MCNKSTSLHPETDNISPRFEMKPKDENILKVVDKQLNRILGKTATEVIYNYLKKTCGMPREEIPSKLTEFANHLKRLLGSSAAELIMKEINQNLKKENRNI